MHKNSVYGLENNSKLNNFPVVGLYTLFLGFKIMVVNPVIENVIIHNTLKAQLSPNFFMVASIIGPTTIPPNPLPADTNPIAISLRFLNHKVGINKVGFIKTPPPIPYRTP
ncbi:hypothetical protein AYI68_g3355 [Smittium mucronatum]|uniref:Uncharacterized protein n=1 Tax=Smittium mucronatum TaxID=133383 RepID=A0A1R0H071_9FUNG|nr:hypothetical protein AYI68_g3355 [Smittium mucronatum]